MADEITLKAAGTPPSEYSVRFLQGMVSRMGTSFYKYGSVEDNFPEDIDALDSVKTRIEKYLETGNTEWLMDAANFCMIEFMRPSHPKAHFRPTESNEAPLPTERNETELL